MSSSPLYALRVPEVFRALETAYGGLTPEEAQARLALYGPNVLREPVDILPLWRKLAGYVAHPMGLLLLVAGGLAFLTGQPTLGLVIWGVVLINAAFSLWQEHRAEMAVATLRKVLPVYARVVRADGAPQESQIPADQIAPGDVLILAEGDHVPADARVVEEQGLRTNHATLTGDAMPMRKTAEASLSEGITELERPNLVFAGTSVVSGAGRAVVFATGMFTQLGRIAQLSQAVKEPPSSIYQDIYRLARVVAAMAVGAGLIAFAVGSADIGMPAASAFLFAIGIVVAITPEGLLPTVTLSLAMAVQRLARRGVLVKKLAVVDTLGKTSVLCIDKSGTLTRNQMTVCRIWTGGRQLEVSGASHDPAGAFSPACAIPADGDLAALLTAAERCNNSRLAPPAPGRPRWSYLGDQTEAALRVVALKGCLDGEALERMYPRVHELPFDARRKRMSTIHRDGAGGMDSTRFIAFVKGAPREVLQHCTHILADGQVHPLDNVIRAEILAVNDGYARDALRVLALAHRTLADADLPRADAYTPEQVEREMTFLGLAAMADPPRPDVAQAVQTCREAGIRLVMVTGDYGLTAESFARRMGMLPADARPRILTGADVESMSDAELQAMLEDETGSAIIFARMAPEHKLRLVSAFQARGEVVAVVGDGVNDAPALRKSDIGIAMGVSGTDVSREAADVILTDDNFAAVVAAIAEGRAVYDNVRKFITYILVSNVPEIMPFVLRALLRIPLALTVPQILAVDLGTDLLPALALGAERPEPDVMQRPPRRRASSLFDRRMIARVLWLGAVETALCYAGFFWVFRAAGYTDPLSLPRVDLLPFAERLTTREGLVYILATTVFHAGLVTVQVGNVFACRRTTVGDGWGWLKNRTLRMGLVVEVLLILLLVYFRPLAEMFEHQPIPPLYWIGLILYAPILYGMDWMFKRMFSNVKRE
jgi:Ca2+-transporting ATPase